MAVAYNFPCLYVPILEVDQAIDRHIHTHTEHSKSQAQTFLGLFQTQVPPSLGPLKARS